MYGQNLNLAVPVSYIENYHRESVTPLSDIETQSETNTTTDKIN